MRKQVSLFFYQIKLVFFMYPGKLLFKHVRMGQKLFVVEKFCTPWAAEDAGLALDAGTGKQQTWIFAADRAHRTKCRAAAAAVAFFRIGLRCRLEKFRGLPARAGRDIIAAVCVARHGRGENDLVLLNAFCGLGSKAAHLGAVLCIRAAGRKRTGDGVLADTDCTGGRLYASVGQHAEQLCKRVLIGAVAVGHERDRRRAAAMQDAAQVGRNLVREPARIGRCADDDKRISGKVKYCFTLCRGIQRDKTEGDTERLSRPALRQR